MEITFQINYHTQWGEQIGVIGSIPELGNWELGKAFKLNYTEEGTWSNTLKIDRNLGSFEYHYVLINDAGELLDEDWGAPRKMVVSSRDNSEKVFNRDAWRAKIHNENGFYNAAFLDVLFKPGKFTSPKTSKKGIPFKFQIRAPRVSEQQRLCVVGSIPELGNWDLSKPLLLGNKNYPIWSSDLVLNNTDSFEYKYGLYDVKQKQVLYLEEGPNRIWTDNAKVDSGIIILNDIYFKHPEGNWKGSGVAVPVFSLRSKESFGVGAFTDIKKLVDWAKLVGMKLVQILPINDTSATNTWVDSYPYAAISVFALHPLYLDLTQLPGFGKAVSKRTYNSTQRKLNALDKVDYEAVVEHKLKYARKAFESEKDQFLKDKAFQSFLKNNQHWLKPYAWFCTLRDKNGTVDFNEWGSDKEFTEKGLKKACSPKSKGYGDIAFYYYLQYHLDKQLSEVTNYAREKGIVLKGDIPIGIYRYSVDAWVQPHLYHMGLQSGAPPDPFSDLGQNWGFPTYNWEEMAKDGYQWWQDRFKTLSRYFDAFRIDHILGFFRIWAVPLQHVQGTLGFFSPAIPIKIQEFYHKGVQFNYDRFCLPFITDEILNDLFGSAAQAIKDQFLEKKEDNTYQFKEEFDSQRKVEAYFEKTTLENGQALRDGLYSLHSNVLFFEDAGSNREAFHPRIDFQKTTSFQFLNPSVKGILEHLYNDYFYNRQEEFWRQQAMTKLPAMKKATNMLICGEDLGMIPACVPPVMEDLGILTLEIQRMSKNPATEFLQAEDIPYFSVCSPSTHDMSPIRAWWEESERPQIQRFYNRELKQWELAPESCSPELAEAILKQHLQWPSMWAIFPLQDLLAASEELRSSDPMEERINIPANPKHYWRYRFHIDLEDLLEANDFNRKIDSMLEETSRK